MNNIIELNRVGNSDIGYLSFFEAEKHIPFPIKRIYYIYEVPSQTQRGGHAHINLNQALWCPYGTVEVTADDGVHKKIFLLDNPNKLLLLGPGVWHNMVWKEERSVLCVAASEYYDEADYIRDYGNFVDYMFKK